MQRVDDTVLTTILQPGFREQFELLAVQLPTMANSTQGLEGPQKGVSCFLCLLQEAWHRRGIRIGQNEIQQVDKTGYVFGIFLEARSACPICLPVEYRAGSVLGYFRAVFQSASSR